MATDGATSGDRSVHTDAVVSRAGAETDAYVSPLADFLLVLAVTMPIAVGSVALVVP